MSRKLNPKETLVIPAEVSQQLRAIGYDDQSPVGHFVAGALIMANGMKTQAEQIEDFRAEKTEHQRDLTPKQVAAELHCSVNSVYGWIRNYETNDTGPQLPARRLGGLKDTGPYRIKRADLENFRRSRSETNVQIR